MQVIFLQIIIQRLLSFVVFAGFLWQRFVGIDHNGTTFYRSDRDPLRIAAIYTPVATTKHILESVEYALSVLITIKENLCNHFAVLVGKRRERNIINRRNAEFFCQINVFG